MSSLPLAIHTAAQVRALDRYAIEHLQISSYTLMTRAATAALATLRSCWPSARRIVIVCGPGNNGGDGYVLARLARGQQLDVVAMTVSDTARLRGDALRGYEDYLADGGIVRSWNPADLHHADVVVDAMFGIGLSRPVEKEIAAAIHAINASGAHVLALDVPSGLDADTGEVLEAAVKAERTLTFIGLKLGFYTGAGPDHSGIVMFDDLDVPSEARASIEIAATRIDENELAKLLPRRRRSAHKGQQGHVLVIGGNIGMAGAARMTAEAALRVGAGLVTVATRSENVAAILSGRPELMCRGVERGADLHSLIEHADVLAVGPGLGQDAWAGTMLDTVLESAQTAVVDADALNLLARAPRAPRENAQWILTPHPGEAGRLLGKTTAEVQRDRLGSARAIASRYGATVVLKGAGTLVIHGEGVPSICDRGNPGMASPGMGDVLTGVIAGIAAQTSDPIAAARVGVLVHAMAGDMAALRGERGLLATDLFTYLPTCVNSAQRF